MFFTCSSVPCLSDIYDDALNLAGLSRENARFDHDFLRLYGFDEFIMPSYLSIENDPCRGSFYFGLLKGSLRAANGKASSVLMSTRTWTGEATRRDLLGNPTARWQTEALKDNSIKDALKNVNASSADVKMIPETVQKAAALILFACRDSMIYRQLAFKDIPNLESEYQFIVSSNGGELENFNRLHNLLKKADLKYLYSGAHDLLSACEAASEWLKDVDPTLNYEFTCETPYGKIILRGAGNHITANGEYLLIIDTGGDDTYYGGASNSSINNWLSITIDTQGSDKYLSHEQLLITPINKWASRNQPEKMPAFGGAVFGVSVLIDNKGDDLYRSHLPSFGSARFGVGVLLDNSGNDIYDSYSDSQGFAMCGLGALIDIEGNDKYISFSQSQGCGFPRGVGMLIDLKGNDEYIAEDNVIDFPSPQTQEHNVSLSQGAGYGFRADYSHGHSLAGGLGILFDADGDDKYGCGVFGQGVGYWRGIGALIDSRGNDVYHGVWYVQGASAHFAIGYLEDESGNDSYTATMNMAQGAGHDYSIGYLIERDGNDKYSAPNLSLGAGNANGIGIFVDYKGDDVYSSRGTTLGMANPSDAGTLRGSALCLGLFMDLTGSDVFPEGVSHAIKGKRSVQWARRNEHPFGSQLGIFWNN